MNEVVIAARHLLGALDLFICPWDVTQDGDCPVCAAGQQLREALERHRASKQEVP